MNSLLSLVFAGDLVDAEGIVNEQFEQADISSMCQNHKNDYQLELG